MHDPRRHTEQRELVDAAGEREGGHGRGRESDGERLGLRVEQTLGARDDDERSGDEHHAGEGRDAAGVVEQITPTEGADGRRDALAAHQRRAQDGDQVVADQGDDPHRAQVATNVDVVHALGPRHHHEGGGPEQGGQRRVGHHAGQSERAADRRRVDGQHSSVGVVAAHVGGVGGVRIQDLEGEATGGHFAVGLGNRIGDVAGAHRQGRREGGDQRDAVGPHRDGAHGCRTALAHRGEHRVVGDGGAERGRDLGGRGDEFLAVGRAGGDQCGLGGRGGGRHEQNRAEAQGERGHATPHPTTGRRVGACGSAVDGVRHDRPPR